MRIAIILGNDGSDVRIGKTCRSLSRMGHDVHFIGWDRRPHQKKQIDLGGAVPHVIESAAQFGKWSWTAQLHFTWHVLRTLARLRPDTVCAVNEDNAFRVAPLRGLFYKRLVCDVFDSHIDRASTRRLPIRFLLVGMSELARCGCDALIATDESRFQRFGRHRSKTTIVSNFPQDPGNSLALSLPKGHCKIYVAGSLHKDRGAQNILEAVEQSSDAMIVSAGWANDFYTSDIFLRHPKVQYHGIVTAERSLELAASCDAVLALYLPSNRNNIMASPNKVYDAMSVGRPVIINSEVQLSQWVVDNGLGFRCAFHDRKGLANIVNSLVGARNRIREFALRARQMFMDRYTWGKMEKRLAAIYSH